MRILIVNDDGIGASQLAALIRWCRKLGEVTAAVPKYEQSGKSHSIELHRDFEARQVTLAPDITAWAVDSTPADCVRFAVLGLKQEFDLVISGINRGLNIGTDSMYSGTVGAACEAVNLGIPAIALSTQPKYYDRAVEHLDSIFQYIRERELLCLNNLYNINIPADPRGIRITRQGGPYYSDDFPCVGDGIYRPTGKSVWRDSGDDSLDTDATLRGRFITVTPLTVDKTNHRVYQLLSRQNP